jgi:phenylacetic acid degradation operon negative regulatory protein
MPSAKSVILDLLSTLKGGAMPVRALVSAGGLFQIEENAVRVAPARLCTTGLVERDERGQYRLGAQAAALNRRIASWRTIEEPLRRWDGAWIGVHTIGLPRRPRRVLERRRRALRSLGFRELRPGLEVRPDNLAGGARAACDELGALGLESEAAVFRLDKLDSLSEVSARGLWNVAELVAGYRASRQAVARREKRPPAMAPRAAMVESFVLGGRVIRQIVLDPLLPEPLLPAGERQALVTAMRRYDRAGRACWAGFLREFGVLHDRTPADLRFAETPERLGALEGGATA